PGRGLRPHQARTRISRNLAKASLPRNAVAFRELLDPARPQSASFALGEVISLTLVGHLFAAAQSILQPAHRLQEYASAREREGSSRSRCLFLAGEAPLALRVAACIT